MNPAGGRFVFPRAAAGLACLLALGACLLASCEECGTSVEPPPAVPECTGDVTVSVSGGVTPVFSWSPDCLAGRLIVEGGPGEEYWGTESPGHNIYRSPIVYGVHPDGSVEHQVPQPLTPGVTYTVSVYRWPVPPPPPDSLDTNFILIGTRQFTP